MNGLEVQSRLREISPTTRLIIFTGKESEPDRVAAFRASRPARGAPRLRQGKKTRNPISVVVVTSFTVCVLEPPPPPPPNGGKPSSPPPGTG